MTGAALLAPLHASLAAVQAGQGYLQGLVDVVREVMRHLLYLPPQASDYAVAVDDLQFFQISLFWAMGVVTLGSALWFAVRYRRREPRSHPVRTPMITAPAWLELAFSGLLLGLFVLWWVIGFGQYTTIQAQGDDAYEIYVTAKQWMFKFDYPEGMSTAGVVFVPAGRRVRFYLTSRDVIHSFFVPDFRVKQDALPGRYTTVGFTPKAPGRHQVLCAELCGTGHARMWAQVVVLSPEDFEGWVEGGQEPPHMGPITGTAALSPVQTDTIPEVTMAERGRAVAAEKGCLNCHTVDGTPHVAPTWLGLYGSRERLSDGDTVVVDPGYITESMMDPQAEIVAGFGPIMPSFQGQVTPREVSAIVEYLRALRNPEAGPPRRPATRGALPDTVLVPSDTLLPTPRTSEPDTARGPHA